MNIALHLKDKGYCEQFSEPTLIAYVPVFEYMNVGAHTATRGHWIPYLKDVNQTWVLRAVLERGR